MVCQVIFEISPVGTNDVFFNMHENQRFKNPPPLSLWSSKAVLFLPSKGGIQKIEDFLPTVNHTQ
jgi:hypothetical protein